MKCPYRKKTTVRNGDNSITYEDFMDCYKEECPFYSKRIGVGVSRLEYEDCLKASKEAI